MPIRLSSLFIISTISPYCFGRAQPRFHVSLFHLSDQFPEFGLNLRTLNTGKAYFLRHAKQVLPV